MKVDQKILKEILASKSDGESISRKSISKKYGVSDSVARIYHNICSNMDIILNIDEIPIAQEQESFKYSEQGQDSASLSGQAYTLDQLLRRAQVDLEIWEVERWEIKDNSWDVTMAHRDQDLAWTKEKNEDGVYGQIMEGHSKRKPGGVTKTNKQYYIKVTLKRKKDYFNKVKFKEEYLEDLKSHSPEVLKFDYPKYEEDRYALEISLFDVHFDKLGWSEETGSENTDSKLASRRYLQCVKAHLAKVKNNRHNIEKIIFPVGNDFFNSDGAYPYAATTRGTPQQSDVRWQKSFRDGKNVHYHAIDLCKQVAPVEIIVIPGNHDFQKMFYLGEVLDAYFHNDQNVTVNNSAKTRKYIRYGNSLIGYTHGNRKDEPLDRILMLMQNEAKMDWAETYFHEWHLGDIHHKKTWKIKDEDVNGMMVKYLRSLSGRDAWHTSKGYQAIKGGESFLWHYEFGLVDNFHYNLILE